jgi:hypothetical protein
MRIIEGRWKPREHNNTNNNEDDDQHNNRGWFRR